MAKETAEQKLLKLIEQSESQSGRSAGAPPPRRSDPQQVLQAVQSVGGSVSLPPAISNFFFVIRGLMSGASRQGGFGVREVNALLGVGIVIVMIVFGWNLWSGFQHARQNIAFQQPESVAFSPGQMLPQFRALQDYVSIISFRNIFQPYEKKVVEAASEEAAAPQIAEIIDSRTKGLKLVGVSWFDTPESASAMVENTESGVTYFLRSGEKVNGVTIEAIYADSIVLEFQGERLELKL